MAQRFGILCATPYWTGPARTAAALTRNGAEVCIVAPPQSYAAITQHKAADLVMPFDQANRNLPSIMRTFAEDFGAHSVLAGDDVAFQAMATFTERISRIELSPATRAMMLRSMPDARTARMLATDSEFIAAQRSGRCPSPESIANPSPEEAVQFATRVGFPVMLKRDGLTAGAGVTKCADATALVAAMAAGLSLGASPSFVVQKFVQGLTYGATASGVPGKAAGAFCFVKHVVSPAPYGPTSVARCDLRPDIIADVIERFEAFGLNGYAGFDYMVDGAGKAHLIEINPRLMPTGHLTAFGVDLTAGFLALTRGDAAPVTRAPSHEYVALFPNEWRRDPGSEYLQRGFHDVPWDDPPLFAAMIDRSVPNQRGASNAFVSYTAAAGADRTWG